MSRIGGFVARLGPALLLGGAVGLWAVGCGQEFSAAPPASEGPVCFQDSDCVPNGCCGRATDAVLSSEAPDCSQVACDGQCPANEINCGCGIPVCSNSQCTVAVTTGPGCPTVKAAPATLE